MYDIVARIPSVLNIRVVGGLVVTAPGAMQYRAAPMQAMAGVTIDGAVTSPVLAGFGFSKAAQWSNDLYGSPGLLSAKQQQILDLLFHPRIGIDFVILRNIIGSSPDHAANHVSSIEAHRPGPPSARSACIRDRPNHSHRWPLHQVPRFGVAQISADTWRARGEEDQRQQQQWRDMLLRSRRDLRQG